MTKLVVASCAKLQQIHPQPIWLAMRAERPDGLLLLGDTIYLENDRHTDPAALGAELRRLWAAQLAEPHFAALVSDLRARGAPVLAVYDDHDFIGDNRYGGDFDPALREAARAELQRALAPERAGGECYTQHHFDLVDVILLDVRFHRRAPQYGRDDADAVLGRVQWEWMIERVSESRAPYLVVGSSTTFHAFADESWEEYPAAFERLRTLLRGRTGALLVSGDVHRNAPYDDSGVIEIVSSGVAGRGAVFGAVRQNYCVLTFDAEALRVELRSLKVHGRFDLRVPLAKWALP
jgi:phosphodiesterase/alkaline phosphatase D-like protein